MRRIAVPLLLVLAAVTLSGCSFISRVLTAVPHADTCVLAAYQLVGDDGQVTTASLEQALDILRQRLDAADLSSFRIEAQPPDAIVVHLPNDTAEVDAARHLLAQRGLVQFVEVPADFSGQVEEGKALPEGMDVNVILTGDEIASANVTPDSTTGKPVLSLEFNTEGATAFDDFAKRVYNGEPGVKFAIVMDDIVKFALTLESDHFGGRADVSGDFSKDEIDRLATLMRFGALPTPVRERSLTTEGCPPAP